MLLVSGVPSPTWASLAAAPLVPGPAADATLAPLPAPAPSPATLAGERAQLCLLGTNPACSPTAASRPSPSAPQGGDPPSAWTQIVPPGGTSVPSVRFLSSMSYYPGGQDVLLFGGYGEPNAGPWVFYQDTWGYASNTWTQLISNSSCTVATCPSPRAGAMMTYYPPDNGILLFGGYRFSPEITYIALNDTWLFANGTWQNLTAQAGPAPSPRFESAMVWDSADDYAVLFGGSTSSGASLGDTWAFHGTWSNITTTAGTAPLARAGAALANSPTGYLMMYGGANNGIVLLDASGACSPSEVGAWFHAGKWGGMAIPGCIMSPAPDVETVGTFPPCGRVNPALAWSPRNNQFALYGGIGPLDEATCTGFQGYLNDTWLYSNPMGSAFNFRSAGDSGDPSNRSMMGYAADFSDNYFEIFGGYNGTDGGLNETWRFFEFVKAQLTGPSNIMTGATDQFLVPFTTTGFGGSGDLTYSFTHIAGVKNSNTLTGTDCGNLTTPSIAAPIGPNGEGQVLCEPAQTSYNVFRLTVEVKDVEDSTDFATANWTFTVSPPEVMAIYSQYLSYFYSNISFTNTFGLLALVAGLPATSVSATIAGEPLTFHHESSTSPWWNVSVNIGALPAGQDVIQATAEFAGNWELNATYKFQVVATPDWLQSMIDFPQVTQKITTKSSGPFNGSFSISESFAWSLSQALGFNINLPFVKGNVSLIPSITVSLTATSKGNISLAGSLTLAPPSINLGIVSIGITAGISLKGTFTIVSASATGTSVKWDNAQASITVTGKFGASVPIYGFNILGVKIGFTLEINVNPSVTLGMILAPTTPGFDEFIQGIAVKIQQFIGSFTLPLSVAVSFGIGFASVAIGGSVSVALEFATNTGLYITNGWINGTIFVSVSALFWSDQWNLASGTIYSWSNPVPTSPFAPEESVPGYDNGTNTTWTVHVRYYAGAGYDENVWLASSSSGPAVADIYPDTSVAAGAASSGAYLFYTNDNVGQTVAEGLQVSALDLNASTNALTNVPEPNVGNFVTSDPVATTLPNGNLYVVWSALPFSETSVAGPSDLTQLDLQGATFYPSNGSWGPVATWTDWGLVQSYVVDATGGTARIAAVIATTYLLGPTSPERLVQFDIASGTEVSNVSVAGVGTVESLRPALGTVAVETVDGNFSTVQLATGTTVTYGWVPAIGGHLISAEYVAGAPSVAVLLDRGVNGSLLGLYDVSTSTAIATLSLPGEVSDAAAIASGSTYYVFVRDADGIEGWTESGGTFANLTTISELGVSAYGLVQFAGGILVYSLISAGGSTDPIVTLEFAEIGAQLPPVRGPGTPPTSSVSSSPSADYALYLGVAAAVVVVLLAVVAVVTRRRPPSDRGPGAPPPGPAAAPPPGASGAAGPEERPGE